MWYLAKVVALHDETPSARTITLDIQGWPGHLAGQHIDVRLTAPDGYSAVRSYSIASAPGGRRIEITVERVTGGEVSPYLTQDVKAGDVLELRGPIGGWFVWRPEQTEPVQLIAGGSGIVPLMAMLRTRGAAGNGGPFRLLYSVREPDAMFYRDELETMADRDRSVSINYAYTRAVPPNWTGIPKRIDGALIASVTWPAQLGPTVYICGPTSFVEAATAFLTANGNSMDKIKTERFGPTGERR